MIFRLSRRDIKILGIVLNGPISLSTIISKLPIEPEISTLSSLNFLKSLRLISEENGMYSITKEGAHEIRKETA